MVFLILNTLSFKFKIYKSVEREDDNHLGTVYFAIAITVIMTVAYFRPEFFPCTGIATFCLTFGDGTAALAGKGIKSPALRSSKSLAGFWGCMTSSLVTLLIFEAFYNTELTFWSILSIALIAAISELVEKGLDNFSVVAGTSLLAWLYTASNIEISPFSILIAEAIFLVVFLSGSIDYWGSTLSMLIVFSFSLFGGIISLMFLLAMYFLIFFVALYKKCIAHKREDSHRRSFLQILLNGGFGLVFMLLYGLTKKSSYLLISIIAIGGCFVDSLSSDIGELSAVDPYDVFKGTIVQRGMSGGMSLLGTTAALLGSVGVGAATYYALKFSLSSSLLASVLIFSQTLVDSAFGSLLQAKYRCAKCGKLTEKANHCGAKSTLISGYAWMDNNMVNLFSSTIITAVAWLVMR